MSSVTRATWWAAVLILLMAGWGFTRPATSQWSATTALGALHWYQRTASAWFSRAGIRCRFVPSCSRYVELAIIRHGIVRGIGRGTGRVLRCGPWVPVGTVDLP